MHTPCLPALSVPCPVRIAFYTPSLPCLHCRPGLRDYAALPCCTVCLICISEPLSALSAFHICNFFHSACLHCLPQVLSVCLPHALSALPYTRTVCPAFHTSCLLCLPHAFSALPHTRPVCTAFHTYCLHCLPHAPVCTAFPTTCLHCFPHFLSALPSTRPVCTTFHHVLSDLPYTRPVCTAFHTPCQHCIPHALSALLSTRPVCTAFHLSELPSILPGSSARWYFCLSLFTRFVCTFFRACTCGWSLCVLYLTASLLNPCMSRAGSSCLPWPGWGVGGVGGGDCRSTAWSHCIPSPPPSPPPSHSEIENTVPRANYRIIPLLLKHLQNMLETLVSSQLKCRISFFFNYNMYHCIFTCLVFSVQLK